MNDGWTEPRPTTPPQAQFRFARQVQRFGVGLSLLIGSSLLFSKPETRIWPQGVLLVGGLVAAVGGFFRARSLLAQQPADVAAQLVADDEAKVARDDVGTMDVHLSDAPARRFLFLAVGGSVLVFVGLFVLMQFLT